MGELVNHPSHYKKEGRKECIEEMEELFGVDSCVIFAILNAYKYNYRCGLKDDPRQEKKKVEWYENYAKEHIAKCEGSFAEALINKYFNDVIK